MLSHAVSVDGDGTRDVVIRAEDALKPGGLPLSISAVYRPTAERKEAPDDNPLRFRPALERST